jgi:ABC-2 type transport system permease protein
MIAASQKALDYYSANFSPYQHKQLRILEFPGYSPFAQSFANTIPFSESIGFIADLRDPNRIDYVSYVTAHEIAHQWWGHQVIGAGVQGQAMLSESLAQYSALMVMEKTYGRQQMHKFLGYELDGYLRARGSELIEELPLMRVENQPYIYYQKGSLVFYRLRDEIGEEALNRALAKFLAANAYRGAPFTTSRELVEYVRAETPPEKYAVLDELFARIVFYDNKVVRWNRWRQADGKYQVSISLAVHKREADGSGNEKRLPLDEWIELGVFARSTDGMVGHEKVLYLQKIHVTSEHPQLTVIVEERPQLVGIDPYNKLIDRNTIDNRMRAAE